MRTQLRQWAIRLLAAVALPIMLTLGLSAAAYAQPTQASHLTSSTEYRSAEHPSTHHNWDVYGPYYYYDQCRDAQDNFGGNNSYCEVHYRYDYRGEYYVWYLYVSRSCGCTAGDSDSRHLTR
jgi:hypothetical protein